MMRTYKIHHIDSFIQTLVVQMCVYMAVFVQFYANVHVGIWCLYIYLRATQNQSLVSTMNSGKQKIIGSIYIFYLNINKGDTWHEER